ncbi:MAG: hypothetical protein WA996_23245 [Candidatus Promineifilaceae bacterium]
MKKSILLSGFMIILLLSACGGTSEEEPTSESELATKEAAPALPTVDSPPIEPGYPGPVEPDAYPGPQDAPGYPAPPISSPTPDSYPAGTTFWMLHPAGLQCEQPLTYPELDDAVIALENRGVTVIESEEIGMMVCEACGCPTSEQYRVQIDAIDLLSAIALGWVRE